MIQKIIFHLKSEWYKYFIEMVVVILGILIAFNLEQWGVERENKKKEIEMLKEFKIGLSADLAEMQSIILFHQYSIQSSKIVLKVIKENLPYHDSLDACFSYTHAFSTFSGRMGPVEQLKNTNLAIVSNDTLRLEIVSMYDEVYPRIRLVELAVKRDYEQLRDFDRVFFDAYDAESVSTNKTIPAPPWGIMHPIRFSELKTNPEYAALLRARISNQMGMLRIHYKPAEKQLSSLLHAIDLEINRLE
ncbi:MAG: DUF6090 family protein [Bacteroidota bacterium]|jgi:hypothetical protein|nr:hypothetical protein [Cytophagales bacterium]MCE2957065.1 DUF6090 family protein [Flammeovirgaceae bacterium]MCZ8070036.1 DUF6090 family protein [Cytophagales bacterium]